MRVVPADLRPARRRADVCVLPRTLRAHVLAAVRRALGSRALPAGALGFFRPDDLTFGDDVCVSPIVAAAHAVAGVENARVMDLRRLEGAPTTELDDGVLRLGPLEVARLDHDPDAPENGRLELKLEGGR